jgi:hypothetical protein
MGVKLIGIDSVSALLIQDGKRATSAALRQMRKEAKIIKELSVANSPVDEGNLEAAHAVEEIKKGNERTVIEVGVGGIVNGVDVDAYATEMHEGLYSLGPRSEAKQASNGHIVGRKFLERALDEREPKMKEEIETAVSDAL